MDEQTPFQSIHLSCYYFVRWSMINDKRWQRVKRKNHKWRKKREKSHTFGHFFLLWKGKQQEEMIRFSVCFRVNNLISFRERKRRKRTRKNSDDVIVMDFRLTAVERERERDEQQVNDEERWKRWQTRSLFGREKRERLGRVVSSSTM